MAQIREIKKRIKAVGNIRRITKTMQMIATSKFAKAQQRALASKPYTEGVYDLVQELASRAGNVSHPLIDGPADGFASEAHEVNLLVTSDRGLCGPYNGSLIRAFFAMLREAGGGSARDGAAGRAIDVVGRKGQGVLKFNDMPIARMLSFGDTPRYEEIERLASDYMERFVAGEITAVRVVYMRFVSTSRQRPEVLQLLPLRPPADTREEGGAASVEYDFSPEPEELLADLLPETVKATLFQAFNDAVVSEHVARMVAMKSATDNAGKLGKTLKRDFNRARQAQITTELSEIIAGSAALD